jgi:hypothetical protein
MAVERAVLDRVRQVPASRAGLPFFAKRVFRKAGLVLDCGTRQGKPLDGRSFASPDKPL